MSNDKSWSNAAFQQDEEFDTRNPLAENYQIPRVGINREVTNRTPKTPQTDTSDPPPYESAQEPQPQARRKGTYSIKVDSDDDEDYSLKSYFKHLQCYKAIQGALNNAFKNDNFSRFLKRLGLTVLLICYVVYFVCVLTLESQVEDENYWCDGDGFLVVLTVVCVFFAFYFHFFKPRILKKLQKNLWSKLKETVFVKNVQKIFDSAYMKLTGYAVFIAVVVLFVVIDSADDRSRLISLLGVFVLILFGFLFSAAPRKVIWRHVVWGLGLQFIMGLIILRWSVGRSVFRCLGSKVSTFLKLTDRGSSFVYGKLVSELHIFVFEVLSVILFFSFCIQILYYYGIMQWIVIKLGWLLQISIGTTACESVNAAANIFLGQSEAPLLIKPFLSKMTKSELHAVMTGGFATIAGSVLAAYISFGVDPAHLLSASVMSAPAALGFAKLFYPEVEVSETNSKDIEIKKGTETNVLHAACEGVITAIPLVANVTANLIAFIAFIAFVDVVLNWFCVLVTIEDGVCSLSNFFGYAFTPLAWIMGVHWQDCYVVGQLLGTKTIVNEFVGYLQLRDLIKSGAIMKRSEIIATYALCGFSNISGIGIQLGALGAMAPDRIGDLAQIALRAMIAGSVACFLTACVAGSLLTIEETNIEVVLNATAPT